MIPPYQFIPYVIGHAIGLFVMSFMGWASDNLQD